VKEARCSRARCLNGIAAYLGGRDHCGECGVKDRIRTLVLAGGSLEPLVQEECAAFSARHGGQVLRAAGVREYVGRLLEEMKRAGELYD